jgi:hypothetical protein
MTEAPIIDWPGQSGRSYRHWIYPLGSPLVAKAGNYVFAKETTPGNWRPIYFGETKNLSERFDYHHKIECARGNGATHIHAHVNDGTEQQRRDEETDLVRRWKPVCND